MFPIVPNGAYARCARKAISYQFAGSVRNQMSEIFTHTESAFFKSWLQWKNY